MKIILYRTLTCPKCHVLAQKLQKKNLVYEECTDVESMRAMGIMEVPQLQVDGGALMNLREANAWINAQEAQHG